VEVLGPAAELRTEAENSDAEKRAPITFAHADTLFAEAENMLRDQPEDPEQARVLATAAAEEYRHAGRLALLADSISDKKVTPEEILLRHGRSWRRSPQRSKSLRTSPRAQMR
jgi:hypothetical protein